MSYLNIQNNFFGQKPTLDLLKRRVIDLKEGYRQNIALLGNKYIGKSSVLHNFILNFDDKDVVVIYLDLENKDFNYLFHKFTLSLVYNFLKNQQLPLQEDLNLLLETGKDRIPHTVQVIKKIQTDFEKNRTLQTFLGLMALPEIFTNETGKFCVLVIDEFQNFEDLVDANVFLELGKKIMTQKKCLYILSSSYSSTAKKILSEKLSLLFGNFETINVEPFDLKTSQEFISSNLQDIRIGSQLRSFLTDFCGGHPFYLSLICQELLNLSAIHKQSEIYLPLLSQSIENTIFNKWGIISRHFELIINELCIGKGNKVMSSILVSLANGRNKVEELTLELSFKKNQIVLRLNKLSEMGIVIKNGSSYYFRDKLFKYWMKYVYTKRIRDLELSPDKQRKQFKDEFNHLVDNFKISSRKDFSSRVVELLHCFDNEAFNYKGRKYDLPLFKDIVPLSVKKESGANFAIVQATGENTKWLVIAKKEGFGENDINAVLAAAKNMDRRPNRCVIISLSTLEENTRLRALQEKFWVWSEEEVNTLLTFFDKPYIV